MLIFILLGIVIIVSSIIVFINRKQTGHVTLFYVFISILIISAVLFVVLGIWAAIVKGCEDSDYRQAAYERDILQYRWDNSKHDSEELYDYIVRFNTELHTCKLHHDSLWIGVFFNSKKATIEYVDIGGIDYDFRSA